MAQEKGGLNCVHFSQNWRVVRHAAKPLLSKEIPCRRRTGFSSRNSLSDLAALNVLAILALDGLHLVLEAQFQLLKPDFF